MIEQTHLNSKQASLIFAHLCAEKFKRVTGQDFSRRNFSYNVGAQHKRINDAFNGNAELYLSEALTLLSTVDNEAYSTIINAIGRLAHETNVQRKP